MYVSVFVRRRLSLCHCARACIYTCARICACLLCFYVPLVDLGTLYLLACKVNYGRRRFMSLLCVCDVVRVIINSLVLVLHKPSTPHSDSDY